MGRCSESAGASSGGKKRPQSSQQDKTALPKKSSASFKQRKLSSRSGGGGGDSGGGSSGSSGSSSGGGGGGGRGTLQAELGVADVVRDASSSSLWVSTCNCHKKRCKSCNGCEIRCCLCPNGVANRRAHTVRARGRPKKDATPTAADSGGVSSAANGSSNQKEEVPELTEDDGDGFLFEAFSAPQTSMTFA